MGASEGQVVVEGECFVRYCHVVDQRSNSDEAKSPYTQRMRARSTSSGGECLMKQSGGLTRCRWRAQGSGVKCFVLVVKSRYLGRYCKGPATKLRSPPSLPKVGIVSFPFPFSSTLGAKPSEPSERRCVMGPHLSLPRCILGTVIAWEPEKPTVVPKEQLFSSRSRVVA